MNCPQLQICRCFSFLTRSTIRLVSSLWSWFWWKGGNATKGKQAKQKEVRMHVGRLRRSLMSLCLQNQDNLVEFCQFCSTLCAWHCSLTLNRARLGTSASEACAVSAAWPQQPTATLSFNFTSCQWRFCCPLRGTWCIHRLRTPRKPEGNTCPVVACAWCFTMPIRPRAWVGGTQVKSIIINDFSRVSPAAPGPPITRHHSSVDGPFCVFSSQAGPNYIDTSLNFSNDTPDRVPPLRAPLSRTRPRAPLSFSTIGITSTARRICSRLKGMAHVLQWQTIFTAMWLHIIPGTSCHNKKCVFHHEGVCVCSNGTSKTV